MTYFLTILLGVYSALATLLYLRFRKNKIVKGIEGFVELSKWLIWVVFWIVPPMFIADQYGPKKGLMMLFFIWVIPSIVIMVIKGREAWKRGEWAHQLRKKELHKNREF